MIRFLVNLGVRTDASSTTTALDRDVLGPAPSHERPCATWNDSRGSDIDVNEISGPDRSAS
jgi:hypothetical protein